MLAEKKLLSRSSYQDIAIYSFLYFASSYRTSCHLALHWGLEKSIASGSPLTYDISLKQVNTFSFPKIRLSKVTSPLQCYDNSMGTR